VWIPRRLFGDRESVRGQSVRVEDQQRETVPDVGVPLIEHRAHPVERDGVYKPGLVQAHASRRYLVFAHVSSRLPFVDGGDVRNRNHSIPPL
jgi:hypothetical protein